MSNKVLIGPGVNPDSEEFVNHVLAQGMEVGTEFEVVETDRYASNLTSLVGEDDAFMFGPGIQIFRDDEEFLEHLDQRLKSLYDFDLTFDQFAKLQQWRSDKGFLSGAGEAAGSLAVGIASIPKMVKDAAGEVGEALSEGQFLTSAIASAAEVLPRWFTGLGVSGNQIKGTIAGAITRESMREKYERVMAQKQLEADMSTDAGRSIVGDFANHVSPEFADQVHGRVMDNATNLGVIAADIWIGARGVSAIPRLGAMGARFSAAAERVSALPGGVARKIAEKTLDGAAVAGRPVGEMATRMGNVIDNMVAKISAQNAILTGAVVDGGTGAAIAGARLGYPALRLAAMGSMEATRGAYTAARHLVTQAGPHQLTYWQRIMRDASAPGWARATAASAHHVFGARGTRLAAAATHGAMVEAAQEALTEWLADPYDYEAIGHAAGAALVLGGGIHAGMNLANLEGMDAYYRNLDRLDYRQALPDPTLYDSLPLEDQLALSDAQAFLGNEYRVQPMTRSQMAPFMRQQTGAVPAPDIAAPAGVYLPHSKTLGINVEARRPTGATILHEVGHAVYESLPQEVKQSFKEAARAAYGDAKLTQFARDYAEATGREGISDETLLDEFFAEQFMGNTPSPLFQTPTGSVAGKAASRAGRALNHARGAVFREWAKRANLDPEVPHGLLPFTPWANDPVIREMVRRETNNLINNTVTDPNPDFDLEEDADDIPAPPPAPAGSRQTTTPPPAPDDRFRRPEPAAPASSASSTTPPPSTQPAKPKGKKTRLKFALKRDPQGRVQLPPELRRMEKLWNEGKSMGQIADEMGTYKMDVSRAMKLYGPSLELISLEANKDIRKAATTQKRRSTRGRKRHQRDMRIIDLVVREGKSLREAGEIMGVSHETVRKVHNKWKARENAKAQAIQDLPPPALSPDPLPPARDRQTDIIAAMIADRSKHRSIGLADGSIVTPIGMEGETVLAVDTDQASAAALLDTTGATPHETFRAGIAAWRAGEVPWTGEVRSLSPADLEGAHLLTHDGFTGHVAAAERRASLPDSPAIDTSRRGTPDAEIAGFLTSRRGVPEWMISEFGAPIAKTLTHTDYRHPGDPSRVMRVPAGFNEPTLDADGSVSLSPRRPLSYVEQMRLNRDLGGDVRFEGLVNTPTGPKPLHSLPARGATVHPPDVQRWLADNGFSPEGAREDGVRIAPDPTGFRRDPETGAVSPHGALAYRPLPTASGGPIMQVGHEYFDNTPTGQSLSRGYQAQGVPIERIRESAETQSDLFSRGGNVVRSQVGQPGGDARPSEGLSAPQRDPAGLESWFFRDPVKYAKEAAESLTNPGDKISNNLSDWISKFDWAQTSFDWTRNAIGKTVEGPEDAFAVNAALRNPFFESLRVIVLDGQNRVVRAEVAHVGTLAESTAAPRDVIRILQDARRQTGKPLSKVVLSHNHPSGAVNPSAADIQVTRRIKGALNAVGGKLIDHVITNGTQGFSIDQGEAFRMPDDYEVPYRIAPSEQLAAVSDPSLPRALASRFRAANPEANYALMLDTKNQLIGALHLPEKAGPAARAAIQGATEIGAKNIILTMGNPGSGEVAKLRTAVTDAGDFAQIEVLDILTWDGSSTVSMRELGLMEPTAEFDTDPDQATVREDVEALAQTQRSPAPDQSRRSRGPGDASRHQGAGLSVIAGNDQGGARFREALLRNAQSQPLGAAVEVKGLESYQDPGMTLIMSEGGDATVAVTSYGDVVSVSKRVGSPVKIGTLLDEAIARGGKTLDAYDIGGFLPDLYKRHGFKVVSRVRFNPEFAPAELLPALEAAGEASPDIILAVHDPNNVLMDYSEYANVRDHIEIFDNWDDAAAVQAEAMRMIEAAGQEVQTPDIAPDEIARVDPSQDVRRVGTAKMGTKVKPRETTQDDNLTLEHAFNVIPPKKLKVQIDGMAKRPEIPAAVRQVRDPKKRAERMIEFFKENLLALHDAFPAELRARATHWYDGANKIASDLANQWGLTLEQAGGIIAVLSPQKDWFMNVAQARQATEVYLTQADSVIEGPDFDRVFDENIDGLSIDKKALAKHRKATGRPDLTKAEALDIARATRRAVFDALKGQTIAGLDHNPGLQAWAIRMTAEAKMGREFHIISPEGETMGVQMSRKTGEPVKNGWGPTPEIVKLVSIIKDGSLKNISEQLGQKHKVRNFFNNIVAPNNSKGDSTMDTHAVAAAHLLPLGSSAPEVSANFGSTGSPGNGVNGTYYLYQEAYRRAALERGLQPRQMQSITWEAIRGLFLPEDRRGAIVPATRKHWKDHANDPDTARAKLLERPIVPPFWADRDGDGQ